MVVTRRFETRSGSGSGVGSQDRPVLTEDRVREIIHDEVVEIIWGQIPEMFGSVKITMMEYFDEIYASIAETVAATTSATVAAAGAGTGQAFQYRHFDNTKPPPFDGTQDPIIAMRWLSDMEVCFFTCSCLADQKVRCALNLLRFGAKDWWRLMTGSYTNDQIAAVTWEKFREVF